MNRTRRFRIEATQEAMDRTRPSGFARAEPNAEGFVPRRGGGEAVDECPEVQSGAACDDWQVSPNGDCVEQRTTQPGEIARGENLRRVGHVNQMVRDAAPLLWRQLGGADVEETIDLNRVAIEDFASETRGQAQGKLTLSCACGPGNCDQIPVIFQLCYQ